MISDFSLELGPQEAGTVCDCCGTRSMTTHGFVYKNNEAHVDHITPKVRGGNGSPDHRQARAEAATYKRRQMTADFTKIHFSLGQDAEGWPPVGVEGHSGGSRQITQASSC